MSSKASPAAQEGVGDDGREPVTKLRQPATAAVDRLLQALNSALLEHRRASWTGPPDHDAAQSAGLPVEAPTEREPLTQTYVIALLAHELRQPLTAIRYAAACLPGLAGGDPHLGKMGAIIERQAQQMARLVDDLLDISRMRTGKLQVVCQPMALANSIDPAVVACRAAIEKRGQSLAVHLPSSAPQLLGDAVRLTQVFTNLLDNASKYTPPGGAIQLRAVVDGGSLVVTVADSGIGIRSENLSAVFEPFVQEQRARLVDGAGLGIGLAVVRELVEAHGGSVVARSAGDDSGSEFVVTLPLS